MNRDISSLKRWRPWELDLAVETRKRPDHGLGTEVAEPPVRPPDRPRARDAGAALPFSGLHATAGDADRLRNEHIARVGEAPGGPATPRCWEFHFVGGPQEIAAPARSSDEVVRAGHFRIDCARRSVDHEDGCPTGLDGVLRNLLVALAAGPAGGAARETLSTATRGHYRVDQWNADLRALRRRFGADAIVRKGQGLYGLGTLVGHPVDQPAIGVGPDWTLCPTHAFLKQPGRAPIPLGPREVAVLRLLVRHAGQVVTYGQVGDSLSATEKGPVSYAVVTTVCAKLRRVIPRPLSIKTIRNVGYRLDLDATASQ